MPKALRNGHNSMRVGHISVQDGLNSEQEGLNSVQVGHNSLRYGLNSVRDDRVKIFCDEANCDDVKDAVKIPCITIIFYARQDLVRGKTPPHYTSGF